MSQGNPTQHEYKYKVIDRLKRHHKITATEITISSDSSVSFYRVLDDGSTEIVGFAYQPIIVKLAEKEEPVNGEVSK